MVWENGLTTTAQGKAFPGMLGVFAQLERDTISERTRDVLQHKKENGEWVGKIPFGFTVQAGRLVEDPEELKIISRIKRMRRDEKSYGVISKAVGLPKSVVHGLENAHLRNRKANYLNGVVSSGVR